MIVFGIILLAAVLRFTSLDNLPPSLTWDEAAWGYNAYSLGINLRDEFGRFLPLTYLESFGDFKPPLYAYLSILPIKLFGLSPFATRFASAFFGVLTVVIAYFLTKQLFKTWDHVSSQVSSQVALLSAGILAISPWHILLSRAAFEANVATFFIVLGVLLFLKATSRGVVSSTPPRWNGFDTSVLCLSILSFVLSMYTFNSARVVVPLLLFGLIIGKRKELLKMKKQFLISILFGLFIFSPLFLFLQTPQAKLRFAEVNIFSDIEVVERVNMQIENDNNAWWSKIIHNRRLAYGVEYLRHYFDNLSPNFLFIKGDGNPKFSIQDVGQLYLFEIPFFIAGAFLLFRKKEGDWWIIPYWMLISIIPAATARETPHALRIESALPTFQILTAYGIHHLVSTISKIQIKYLIFYLYTFFLIFNFLYFTHNYFSHYSKEFSHEWQYGYKDAISYVRQVEDQYDRIYFTESLGRPYIYFLFYTQYDPVKFGEEVSATREVLGFVHIENFDKYYFAKDLQELPKQGKILFIDTPNKVPDGFKIEKTFHLLNGERALIAYTL